MTDRTDEFPSPAACPVEFTYPEAVEQLPVSRWWLHDHIAQLPYQRYGTKIVRFDAADIAGIREKFAVRPGEPKLVALRPVARHRA